jgi:CDGSH-type Zn-finger protein
MNAADTTPFCDGTHATVDFDGTLANSNPGETHDDSL